MMGKTHILFPASAMIFLASRSSAPVCVMAANSSVMPTSVVNMEVLKPPIRSLSVRPKIRTMMTPNVTATTPTLTLRKKASRITTMNSTNEIMSNAVSINISLSVFFQMMDSRASQQQGGVLVLMFC